MGYTPTYRITVTAYGLTLSDNFYNTSNLNRIMKQAEEQARKELRSYSPIYNYDPNTKLNVTISSWVN